MSQITWKNVNSDIPDISGNYGAFSDALTKAFSGLGTGLKDFQTARQDVVSNVLKSRLLRQDNTAEYQNALRSGEMLNGVDPSLVSGTALDMLGNQVDVLKKRDAADEAMLASKADRKLTDARTNSEVDGLLTAAANRRKIGSDISVNEAGIEKTGAEIQKLKADTNSVQFDDAYKQAQTAQAKAGTEMAQGRYDNENLDRENARKNATAALAMYAQLDPSQNYQNRMDLANSAGFATPEAHLASLEQVNKDYNYNPRELTPVTPNTAQSWEDTLSGSGNYDRILNKVVGVEASGNPNAANPKSSAKGLGQFIDETWLSTVAKHAPELMKGRSKAEVLALKTDPDISKRMLDGFTKDNIAALKADGVPVNGNTIYMAHHFGAGKVKKVLNSPANTPVEALFTSEELDANPHLKKAGTASGVRMVIGRKMGSEGNLAVDGLDTTVAKETATKAEDAIKQATAIKKVSDKALNVYRTSIGLPDAVALPEGASKHPVTYGNTIAKNLGFTSENSGSRIAEVMQQLEKEVPGASMEDIAAVTQQAIKGDTRFSRWFKVEVDNFDDRNIMVDEAKIKLDQITHGKTIDQELIQEKAKTDLTVAENAVQNLLALKEQYAAFQAQQARGVPTSPDANQVWVTKIKEAAQNAKAAQEQAKANAIKMSSVAKSPIPEKTARTAEEAKSGIENMFATPDKLFARYAQ